MTDYEKLLEEADVTVRVLRASVPMVNADEAETIRRLAAALREVMAERDEALAWSNDESAQPESDAIRAAHPTRTGKHETYAEALRLVGARRTKGALLDLVNWLLVERDEMADAAKSRALDEERFALFRGMQEQRDTALADAEAMRAALSDAATALEQASDDLTIDSRNEMRHQRGDVATVELSIEGLATAALDAMVAAERAKSALDARATPPASHRCPGCNTEHRGEYDHCETCRARIATPSGGKGQE